MYIMTCMRSDMAYLLGVMSRYQSDSGENYQVIKTILKYLRNTKDQWLIYEESDLKLMGFTNSNFQSDHDDSKSMSGYIYTLNNGVICWKCSKQHTVADSTCKAEYITAFDAVKDVMWL